jgi:hypothetical protein
MTAACVLAMNRRNTGAFGKLISLLAHPLRRGMNHARKNKPAAMLSAQLRMKAS